MNKMREAFKKIAEENTLSIEKHLGELINQSWEVVRVSSRVIDQCLNTEFVAESEKTLFLILLTRNMLSDCCCCLDALERGHERTIYNNIRMIWEDLCSAIDACENEATYASLRAGKHQASSSISFAKRHYPSHSIGQLYGILSKMSHHMMTELIVRQWVNRDGLLSHIKPFNIDRSQAYLNVLLLITHLARLTGEVAEKLCIDELENPYFWTKQKNPHPAPKIDIIISDLANTISKIMDPRQPISSR